MTAPVYLVTGATDGIGKATAQALASRGASVILHGRHAGKLEAVRKEIEFATGNASLHAVLADFSSLDEVAALAARVRQEHPGLSVLVNNAGVLTDHWQQSRDGFELTFAVNYLAPFLLTLELLATLLSNAPGRIVNVASTALGGGVADFGNRGLQLRFEGWQAYANTKLMNVLFSHVLAGRLAGSGVTSNALCPGLIDTNFFHTNRLFADGGYERLKPRMRTAEEGALVPLYLAADPAAAAANGCFFVREGRDGRRSVPLAWDREEAEALWSRSVDAVRPWLTSPPPVGRA